MSSPLYPRLAEARLAQALEHSPAVLVHGPRQCGKTTLARVVGEPRGYRYLTFDDPGLRQNALSDPVGFVESLPERVILDEVQRVPELFTTLKMQIDRRRVPGRFLLTGSTQVLLVPRLGDSLAGRLLIVRLHPLSRAEVERTEAGFLTALFGSGFWGFDAARLGPELPALVAEGGYPTALGLPPVIRREWYETTVDTVVTRDIRELSRISELSALPRLMAESASRTAQLLNLNDLANRFSLSRQTIETYFRLLERMFLVERLPPWASNRLARLVKRPKLHLGDTGMAAASLEVGAEDLSADRPLLGHLTETFVYQELRRQASGAEHRYSFFHCRDRDGVETDLLLSRNRRFAGIEVKAGATVRSSDFRGLRQLQRALGDRFVRGVVLYDGERTLPFGPGLSAVPLRALWQAPAEAVIPESMHRGDR